MNQSNRKRNLVRTPSVGGVLKAAVVATGFSGCTPPDWANPLTAELDAYTENALLDGDNRLPMAQEFVLRSPVQLFDMYGQPLEGGNQQLALQVADNHELAWWYFQNDGIMFYRPEDLPADVSNGGGLFHFVPGHGIYNDLIIIREDQFATGNLQDILEHETAHANDEGHCEEMLEFIERMETEDPTLDELILSRALAYRDPAYLMSGLYTEIGILERSIEAQMYDEFAMEAIVANARVSGSSGAQTAYDSLVERTAGVMIEGIVYNYMEGDQIPGYYPLQELGLGVVELNDSLMTWDIMIDEYIASREWALQEFPKYFNDDEIVELNEYAEESVTDNEIRRGPSNLR